MVQKIYHIPNERGITMTKVIRIEGMSCSHCAAAVTKELQAVDGVTSAEVNLEEKTATVGVSAPALTDAALREAVEEAGFEVVGVE